MDVIKGFIHSIETFGALDGPGIRYVVFMQGCQLRCRYCHNPDTWRVSSPAARVMTPEELFEDLIQYKNYIKNGGVTFSGGEPLLQPLFLEKMLELCKADHIHTAIDTSGAVPLSACGGRVRTVVSDADLLLLDIKALDTNDCLELTGSGNENCLKMLDFRESIHKDVWIRHVLVPGLTLDFSKLEKLAEFLSRYSCVKKVELLPFHKMGEYKWLELGYGYTLTDTLPPSGDEVERARKIFSDRHLV